MTRSEYQPGPETGHYHDTFGVDNQEPSAGLTASMNQLAADVTMTSANTYYDGPSLSLEPGTYLLIGTVTVLTTSLALYTAKLWNGTTVLASAESSVPAGGGGFYTSITVTGFVVVASTATWKISVAAHTTGSTLKVRAEHNGAGDNASTLVAVKIA